MAGEPDPGLLKELVEWRPPQGVVSVYLEIDPGDRSDGWRIVLKDGLKPIGDVEGASHERKLALRSTVARIEERFEPEVPLSGRCQIGFVEVAEKPGRELWEATQIVPAQPGIAYRERPHLEPLADLLDDGGRSAPSPFPPSRSASSSGGSGSPKSSRTGARGPTAGRGGSERRASPGIPPPVRRFQRRARTSTTSAWRRTESASFARLAP
jgi:hypothetical protein